MQNNHPYQLEKYAGRKTRHTCPRCRQLHKFTRYIEVQTGQYVAPEVGRCDRQDSCGYHYTPRQYHEDRSALTGMRDAIHLPSTQPAKQRATYIRTSTSTQKAPKIITPPPVTATQTADVYSTMPYQVWADSTDLFHRSCFAQYVLARYGQAALSAAWRRYMFGISDHWPGATIWWQIDRSEQIRTGKVMLYDPATCKRVKQPSARIGWMHRIAGSSDYTLRQCLYGEHLLSQAQYRDHPVAIVESEKTAVLASILVPDYLWLATGGKDQLTAERLAILGRRKVQLYPDAGCYEAWKRRAEDMSAVVPLIAVSRKLEHEQWPAGSDIVDFLAA